jgi:ankyrin repeat protein
MKFSEMITNFSVIEKNPSLLTQAILHEQDASGKSLLHYAVLTHKKEFVLLLLRAGAPYDLPDKHGQTPLFLAVQHNDRPIVEVLLEEGASVDITDDHGKTVHDYAADHSEMLTLLNQAADDNQIKIIFELDDEQ